MARPFLTIAAAAFCAGLLSAGPAAAQTVTDVIACRDISNPDLRLNCYDGTVGSLRQAMARLGAGAPAAPSRSASTDDAQRVLQEAMLLRAEAQALKADAERQLAAAQSGGQTVATRRVVDPLASEDTFGLSQSDLRDQRREANQDTPDDRSLTNRLTFGLFGDGDADEGVSSIETDTPRLSSRIVNVERLFDGRYQLTLENGHIWRTKEGRFLSIRGDDAVAQIRPGRLGAFFLTVDGQVYGMAVERVR